jgi:hypothetical protein
MNNAFRMEAGAAFQSIQVPQRQPAQWAEDSRTKLKSSRLGVVLVDVPGFKVETHGAEGLVVILDEEALSRKAGLPLPASSGGGSHTAGSSKSRSSSDAWQEQGNEHGAQQNGTSVGQGSSSPAGVEVDEDAHLLALLTGDV